jgi:hypothetical protein
VLGARGTLVARDGGVSSDDNEMTPIDPSIDLRATELSDVLRHEHVEGETPRAACMAHRVDPA